MLILLIIVMLSSCRSVERNDEMETMGKDDGLSISFIVDEKYYAELKKNQGMYFLSRAHNQGPKAQQIYY